MSTHESCVNCCNPKKSCHCGSWSPVEFCDDCEYAVICCRCEPKDSLKEVATDYNCENCGALFKSTRERLFFCERCDPRMVPPVTQEDPKTTLNLNTYDIVSEAVDRGLDFGYRRAHKHTDEPSEDLLKEKIRDAIMSELSDVILWPER